MLPWTVSWKIMPAPDHSENHSVFYNKEIEGKGEDTFFQLLRKRKFESFFSENRQVDSWLY